MCADDLGGLHMRTIADLASVSNGRAAELYEILVRERPKVGEGELILLVNDNSDVKEIGGRRVAIVGETSTERDRSAIDAVDREISRTSEVDGGPLLVCSFRTVLEYHVTQVRQADSAVEFLNFRHLLRGITSSGNTGTGPLQSWPSGFIPLEAALADLRAAVTERGAVRQTKLREELTRQNRVWKRVPGRKAPQDDSRIIGLVVREGISHGVVTTSGPQNDPWISTVESPTPAPTPLPATVPARQQLAQATLPSTGVPPVDDGRRESDRYMLTLRNAKLGPFSEVRLAIYEQMKEIVAQEAGEITIRNLIAAAVDRVREKIDKVRSEDNRQYLIRSMTRNLPWGIVKAFITALMTRRAVAITEDNEAVRADWTNLSKKVVALQDKWEIILDSELILCLLANGYEISSFTEDELSGALYDSRQQGERVQHCIAHLIEEGICELGPDYALQLVRRGQHSA